MRRRFAALTATTLAAAAMLLAGCSKGTSDNTNTNTGNTASASPTATTTQPSATATPVISDSGQSPTDALIAYIDAIKRKDAVAVKNLFSKSTLNGMEEAAAKKKTTVEAIIKEGLEEISKDVPDETPKTRNEKIEGDKATLEFRDEKKDKWELVRLVREDGQWKLAFNNQK